MELHILISKQYSIVGTLGPVLQVVLELNGILSSMDQGVEQEKKIVVCVLRSNFFCQSRDGQLMGIQKASYITIAKNRYFSTIASKNCIKNSFTIPKICLIAFKSKRNPGGKCSDPNYFALQFLRFPSQKVWCSSQKQKWCSRMLSSGRVLSKPTQVLSSRCDIRPNQLGILEVVVTEMLDKLSKRKQSELNLKFLQYLLIILYKQNLFAFLQMGGFFGSHVIYPAEKVFKPEAPNRNVLTNYHKDIQFVEFNQRND